MFFFDNTQTRCSLIKLLGSLIGLLSLAGYIVFYSTNILLDQPMHLVIIPRGYSLSQLKDHLQKEGYIQNGTTFLWTAHLLRYNPAKAPGQYRLTHRMSNIQAIRMLRAARQYPVKLTFSRATYKADLVEQLVKPIGLTKEKLWGLLNDPEKLATYGFSTENVLTLFIPDSYEVYWTITAEQLLAKMYRHYQYFWNPIRLSKAQKIGLTPIEVAILASIVQAETNDLQESTMIAGVYLNRLKRKIPLQSDPMLMYIIREKEADAKRVLHKDMHKVSPYNSYRNIGLPPGPIGLPNVAMVDAVLNYVAHDYLFFSAKEDFSGLHYFSRSYKEHVNHANRYRKALNRQGIMR